MGRHALIVLCLCSGAAMPAQGTIMGTGFAMSAAVQPAQPVGVSCTNECCNIHPTPGCSDRACEALVCAVEPGCCIDQGGGIIEWHQGCTMLANALCGVESASDCCNNFQGEPGGPGCDDPDCEELVCDVDPFCCVTSWDTLCAFGAQQLCGDLCCCE